MKKEKELTEKEVRHVSWLLTYINVVMCFLTLILIAFLGTLVYLALNH